MECCEKKRVRTPEELRALTNRLSRIEGQVRGIRRMLESDAYCIDVLTQVAAVEAAMSSFAKEMISSHIKGCVTEDIRSGDGSTVDELVLTLAKLMK